jgi:hypothetical protein
MEEQVNAAGFYGKALQYVRLSYYACLLSPLKALPYRTAQVTWQCLSILAVIGFALLWRIPNRRISLLASCWSLPIIMVFLLAQDVSFLLLLLAIAIRLHRKDRPVLSGLVMSLLSIKFNLFLLLPLFFLGQRRWKMASGFGSGCAVLIAASFWASGSHWPMQMAATLSSKAISPREFLMPNLRGLLQGFTGQLWPEVLLGLGVAVAVFFAARKSDFGAGFAAMIFGSLLVSHHAGPQDCALFLPAILLLIEKPKDNFTQGLCFIALLPCPIGFS